jgi:translation initiation factor IF-3
MRNTQFKQRENREPINDQIRHREMRVVCNDEQLGVMTRDQALNEAYTRGLDLVIISESAIPPVARILDADKYFYELKRKEKEQAKKQRESRIEVKEVQFRPGIDTHDFETKIKHIEKFLSKGAKVKCLLKFRGRENANKQLGFEVMSRIIDQLTNAEWDSNPTLNGNRLVGILRRGTNV